MESFLGRILKVTILDGRVFQGQLMAVDNKGNILLGYAESLECNYKPQWSLPHIYPEFN